MMKMLHTAFYLALGISQFPVVENQRTHPQLHGRSIYQQSGSKRPSSQIKDFKSEVV